MMMMMMMMMMMKSNFSKIARVLWKILQETFRSFSGYSVDTKVVSQLGGDRDSSR